MSTTLVEQAPSTALNPSSNGSGSAFPLPTDVVMQEASSAAAATASAVPSPPLQAVVEAEPAAPRSEAAAATNDGVEMESAAHSPTPQEAAAGPVTAPTAPLPRDGATRKAQLARAQQRLAVQLQFAENARQKIADETHPDLCSRLAALERERDALLARAQQRVEYLRHTTQVIFAYECDEATSEFELSCEKLRQDMLEEIHHEMEIINDQRSGGASSSDSRKTTRKTRSTRAKNGEKEPLAAAFAGLDPAPHKAKKRAGYVFQPLEKRLAQSEVDFDLRELNGVLEASKKRRMEAPASEDLPGVRCHRGKLLYRDWIFQEGDDVFVQPREPAAAGGGSGGAYVAVVVAVTSTELFVLSETGVYARVVVADLRQGRVALTSS
ncbi:hypothetical protein PybrP1_004381 [[Pythium] brassicae (nom. inval.)]|nr:hypothetical protein PybrP1_004381 [[Pythium] brassicae (nom. inval.)]